MFSKITDQMPVPFIVRQPSNISTLAPSQPPNSRGAFTWRHKVYSVLVALKLLNSSSSSAKYSPSISAPSESEYSALEKRPSSS
uniref:Uncharacterized protein n=1 Tax=Glossina pallidipes TaxID=7398 RepID=A0A1B0ACV8_GLOPL